MAKVFVSSTFLDLEECRREVGILLRKMGHEDVAMEYFVAEDKRPVDACLAKVRECDLYVGIIAWRYGWIPQDGNPGKRSVTELEYLEAVAHEKPRLIFLHDPDAPWPPSLADDAKRRIKKFRSTLQTAQVAGFFKSAQDIASTVAPSIHKWSIEHGQGGSSSLRVPAFDLVKYFGALRRYYGQLDLEALTPPENDDSLEIHVKQVFVEPSVRENPPPLELPKDLWEKLRHDQDAWPDDQPGPITGNELRRVRESYYRAPPRPVFSVLSDPALRRSVILGDPGSGKSTLARYLILSLIEPAGDATLRKAFDGYLPILVELRNYAIARRDGHCQTFLEYLEYLGRTEGLHLNQHALHDHLRRDGRAIVIFDGLDELFDAIEREQVARQIAGFHEDYPDARLVVTSRIVGYSRKALRGGFAHFTLQDLEEPRIREFVEKWYRLVFPGQDDEVRTRVDRIMRGLSEPSIRQLAGNPMLLTIMSMLGRHQELPRKRWQLYEHAATVLIQQWDVSRHLRARLADAPFIDEADKKAVLRRLAYEMQTVGGPTGNYIHRDTLLSIFETYLQERYKLAPGPSKAIATAMIEQLRERNFVLSLYGADVFGFVHRGFLEYFSACAFVEKFEKSRELTFAQLLDVFEAHWKDESWHEVLRLICGLVQERVAGELVDHLTDKWYLDDRGPDGMSSVVLAVGCLREIRNLSLVAQPARRLLWVVFQAANDPIMSNVPRPDSVAERLLAAVRAIGPSWPQRRRLADWLDGATRFRIESGHVHGRFLGSVGAGDTVIHDTLLHLARNDRSMGPYACALAALAVGWRDDPGTLSLLMEYARDPHPDHRGRFALEVMGQYFPDAPETLPLLMRLAQRRGGGWYVRYSAVAVLGTNFPERPEVLDLLLETAGSTEPEANVRWAAVTALGRHCRADARVFPVLLDRADTDPAANVRDDALFLLVEHFREEPAVLPLLLRRAATHSHALWLLAQHFREQPDVLPLLLARASGATGDPDAAIALVRCFPDNPEVLPVLLTMAPSNDRILAALAAQFPDEPRVLPLLLDHLKSDSSFLRRSALVGLARNVPGHPQTLPALLDHARNASDSWVRSAAITTLAESFPQEPCLLDLLSDLTTHPEAGPRETALVALLRLFPDHPQTLPRLRDRAENDPDAWIKELAAHFVERRLER